MKILFVWPNKDSPFFRPMSISLFSALLKKEGHETKCFDTSFVDFGYANISDSATAAKINKPVDLSGYNIKKQSVDAENLFLKELQSFNPDLIAFSVISDEIMIAEKLSHVAKKWNKDKIIIWGGKGATVEPEKVLDFVCVDYVCVGEGIIAFPEFVKAFDKGKSFKNINNIWYKESGKVVKNSINPLFENLDLLPYLDWEIFDDRLFYKPYEGKIYRGGDHMIYWGCPNSCTYCINDYYHKMCGGFRVQRYTPRRIIDELKYLVKKYDIEFFKFHDEDFLLKPLSYIEELSDIYAKEVNIPFTCMANSKLVTEKGVKFLKKMNCVSVSLGVETGDLELRKTVLLRRDTEEEIIYAFKLLKNSGIRALAFNMFGIPFETRETYFKTVELNRKINVQVPHMGFFFPFKKTRLREIAIENGFYDPENEKVYDPEKPALHFKNLSEGELIALKKRFAFYVKLPKEFWPFIERSEKPDEIGKALTKKFNEIYNESVFANDGWYDDRGKKEEYLKELNLILG